MVPSKQTTILSRILARNQRSTSAADLDNDSQSVNANPEGDIAGFLRSWVAAWSSRDVDAYLDHYSNQFEPSEGQSLAQWKDRKSRIIEAAEFIKLRVENIEVTEQQENQVDLVFTQSYESNTYESNSRKSMRLQREDDEWRILLER